MASSKQKVQDLVPTNKIEHSAPLKIAWTISVFAIYVLHPRFKIMQYQYFFLILKDIDDERKQLVKSMLERIRDMILEKGDATKHY